MKHKYTSPLKTLIRFTVILSVLYFIQAGKPLKIFSQTGTDPWDRGFAVQGQRILNYHFDRADRELTPGKWMEEARRGLITARAVWAEMVPEVFSDEQAFAAFDEMSEEELERRFTRWLLERFFGAGMEAPAAAIFKEAGEADKILIYHTGSDGNILYDPGTGDPLIIRPGDEGYDFTKDLLAWKKITGNAAEKELQDYGAFVRENYPELLLYISPEREEEFSKKLSAASDGAVHTLKHEFEAILARGERYFTAQRLGDIWSLRKRSDDQSADAVSARLIEDARQVCADGIASIEARIEAARGDDSDLTLAGTQWLEEYREQFNRGLAAWENAEERFLIRRLEWENSAERAYYEGFDAWNRAFSRLEQERRKWEEQARILFLEGEQFFAQASEILEKAIAAAKMEYEIESKLRIGAAAERTEALASMYVLSASAAEEARKNIDFWISRYKETVQGISVPSGIDNLDSWISAELRRQTGVNKSLERFILEELRNSISLYRNYAEKTEKHREDLMRELYSVPGFGSYETELLRAEGELDYWLHRTSMAQAVFTYAAALDAGRITAAESTAAWDKARASYNEADVLYDDAHNSLKAGEAEISAARDTLNTAALNMKNAGAVIETLRQNYNLLSSMIANNASNILAEELTLLKQELVLVAELLESNEENSPWRLFLDCARELENRQNNDIKRLILQQLIAGDGDTFFSLSDIARKENGFHGNKRLLDYSGMLLTEDIITEEQYFLFLSLINENSESWAEDQLDLRLAAISLLLEDNSINNWYFSVYKNRPDLTPGITMPGMEIQLLSDWELSRLELLIARAKLDLGVLDFLDGNNSGEYASILAGLYEGDAEKRLKDRLVLEQILELLLPLTGDKMKIISGGGLNNLLLEASLHNTEILPFLSGYSILNQQYGNEIYEIFLCNFIRNEEFCGTLYNTYTALAALAPVHNRENIERTITQLSMLWEILGIEDNDSVFPETQSLINALKELEEDFTAGIYPLFFIIDEIFNSLPSWLSLGLNQWKNSIIQYCTLMTDESLSISDRQVKVLNMSLTLLKEQPAEKTEYELLALGHFEDPLLEWEADNNIQDIFQDFTDTENALAELQLLYYREDCLKKEISHISPLLELLLKDTEDLEKDLEAIAALICEAEEASLLLASAHSEAAENFLLAGESYDALYKRAETAFKNLEETRRLFEIEDAVKLWAETAYLDVKKPEEELKYCKNRADLAATALEMLISLDRSGNTLPEYEAALALYEENFSLYTLSLEAFYKFEQVLASERQINESAYSNYRELLLLLGGSFSPEAGHISSEDKSLWDIKDMITVENGILIFARDSNNIISGCDEDRTQALIDYFSLNIALEDEAHLTSQFELALNDLAQTLSGLSLTKFTQLSLARDYLVKQIINNNPLMGGTEGWLKVADALRKGNLAEMVIGSNGRDKVKEAVKGIEFAVAEEQLAAWLSLDEKTRKALEFYTILTLLGGGGNNPSAFSRMSEHQEYRSAMVFLQSNLKAARAKAAIPFAGWIYRRYVDKLMYTQDKLMVPIIETRNIFENWQKDFKKTLALLESSHTTYKISSVKLAKMEGAKSDIIQWEDLETAIALLDTFNGDLWRLKETWESINKNTIASLRNTSEALWLLANICMSRKEDSYNALTQLWNINEAERQTCETSYKELFEAYLAGKIELSVLQTNAELSFGEIIPPQKDHLENIGAILLDNLKSFTNNGIDGKPEQILLANEYTRLVNKAWEEKYNSELAAREDEWNLQRRDIGEKLSLWHESASAILEHGRIAWKDGEEKLREACNVWFNSFREEYGRIHDQWIAAYLEGLRDKEEWAAAALEAASGASSSALFALIGSDAEAGARAMDTRDPMKFMNLPDLAEGEKIILDLLEKSGAGYLTAAFGSIQGSRETLATAVRTGVGGNGVWNSGILMSEASSLAKIVREDFETQESQKLACMVMSTAREAYKMLEKNLFLANDQFRKEMDEAFIMGGQWRRQGSGYIKDVVVHSTYVRTVITEKAAVDGYRFFFLPQTQLAGYLYDDLPQNINIFEAEALIDSIYAEINELLTGIFGSGETDGEFQLHLGSEPIFKPSKKIDLDDGRAGVFDDFGEGELGRLLTEFYFWMAKEQLGIAMMDIAPWDKPLWDSRDSKFDAPTLRTAVNIVIQTGVVIAGAAGAAFTGGGSIIGAIAISAAINSADDLVFTALDLAGGYKSWSEAGVYFGKAVAVNAVTATAGAAFSGVSGATSKFFGSGGVSGFVSGGVGGAVWKGFTLSTQTITSGTINSAINSITYTDSGGFDFSTDAFKAGLKQSAISSLSIGAGGIVSGLMNTSLFGFLGDMLDDGNKFSTLTGGLVSQGVNFAFGNDFTLNIFNIGLITGLFSDKEINAGLLELHLGRDGISFQFGTGGVDISAGTLWGALKGTEAFLVNLEMLLSKQEATNDYKRELRALYSQEATTREEYRDVLAGKTKYAEWENDYIQSIYYETSGEKIVYLSRDILEDGSAMGLAVIFAHEAYRDGKTGTKDEQIQETEQAIMGHIRMAAAIKNTYGEGALAGWMNLELKAYDGFLNTDNFEALQAIINSYDTSADFWKLMPNGALAYDGLATLSDINGVPIRSASSMGLASENAIETALIIILGFDPNDEMAKKHVRDLMESSGLVHSASDDPEQWYWRGEHLAETVINGNYLSGLMNLTNVNMGFEITVSAIAAMYDSYNYYGGDSAKAIGKFLSGTYHDPINFLNHYDTNISRWMLSEIYSLDQLVMITKNLDFQRNALVNGIDTRGMVNGEVWNTQGFLNFLYMEKLENSRVPEARFFSEYHTGHDYAGNGISINLPGGYWELVSAVDHSAIYQLYGSDLKIKVSHIEKDEIKKLVAGTIYGGDNNTILPYPKSLSGSGSGTHIHIDITRRLPHENYYTRQFVNPGTLIPSSKLDYNFWYYDKDKKLLESGNFIRF